jgi:cold shock CspA family protein
VREPHSSVVGRVEAWHAEEGWGVLRTPDDVQVWCHFSQVEIDGYRVLEPGEPVWFD